MRALAVMLLLLVGAASCQQRASTEEDQMPQRPISEVLSDHVDELMAVHGVNSVGQGICDENPCITVGVTALSDSLRAELPREIEGYEVRIHEQGAVKAR